MMLSLTKTAVSAAAIFGSPYEVEEYRKLVEAERIGSYLVHVSTMTRGAPTTTQPPPV